MVIVAFKEDFEIQSQIKSHLENLAKNNDKISHLIEDGIDLVGKSTESFEVSVS